MGLKEDVEAYWELLNARRVEGYARIAATEAAWGPRLRTMIPPGQSSPPAAVLPYIRDVIASLRSCVTAIASAPGCPPEAAAALRSAAAVMPADEAGGRDRPLTRAWQEAGSPARAPADCAPGRTAAALSSMASSAALFLTLDAAAPCLAGIPAAAFLPPIAGACAHLASCLEAIAADPACGSGAAALLAAVPGHLRAAGQDIEQAWHLSGSPQGPPDPLAALGFPSRMGISGEHPPRRPRLRDWASRPGPAAGHPGL